MVFDDDMVMDEIEGYSDAGQMLAERYNEYLSSIGDYNHVTDDEMIRLLKLSVTPRELSLHVDDDFTRGLLLGRLLQSIEAEMLDAEADEEA